MESKLTIKKPDLLKPTLIFLAVGLFIPGFTAIALFGFQMFLSSLGMECHTAWKVIWTVTILGGIMLPILFYGYITTLTDKKLSHLKTHLTIFNLLEYTFLQASLAFFFTSGQTLCYVSDGQNGLELVFTAWLGLPILMGFSLLFRQKLKSKND